MTTTNPFMQMILITILGMGIVFAVLIILWATTSLLHVSVGKFEKKDKSDNKPESVPDADAVQSVQTTDADDDEELIAVITAAIAASLNTSTYNLRIKSFRRVGQTAPTWNTISRKEQLENNL